jgi:hypothetical protein
MGVLKALVSNAPTAKHACELLELRNVEVLRRRTPTRLMGSHPPAVSDIDHESPLGPGPDQFLNKMSIRIS